MRAFSVLLSAALLPLVTRAAFHSNDTACTRHYTVQAGDTCDKIGQKTLTSTYQILAFNLLSAGADCYTLEIGTQLCLGRYGNDCQFVHEATDQDTCESIANAYGITTQLLQSNNPSLDCNVVYNGLMLCVSAGSIRPPADNSINATDVRAAREVARQMWLAQEQTKASQSASLPATQVHQGSQHHAPSSGKSQTAHGQHHHKQSSNGGKSNHKQHAHKGASEASPQHTKHHHQRAAQDDIVLNESYDQAGSELVEELLVVAPIGSNHTPEHQAQADSATGLQRRHRSLSSRSHHQRSHTL